MAIAKTIEIIATSTIGIEDAVKQRITKARETVKKIEGFWEGHQGRGSRQRGDQRARHPDADLHRRLIGLAGPGDV